MQTQISEKFRNHENIEEAENILRACVHCGFCTATCPTYQLLGDELDGPRGRIYLIKQVLEGNTVTNKTQQHLDRCLTCRSCETTCPSGVKYGRLVDIGREIVEEQVSRPAMVQLKRLALRKVIPFPARLNALIRISRWIKPILPERIKHKIPSLPVKNMTEQHQQKRKMLVLDGCAQSVLTPATNEATVRVLQNVGIELIRPESAGCCGALSQHLSAAEEAADFMRQNINAWWPCVEQGAEALIITASGCGSHVKEYGELLKHDKAYAEKAKKISELARDVSEIISQESLTFNSPKSGLKVAFHCPCTLQHGQQLAGVVESILTKAGYELTSVEDSHICCGSAGTYSILQPELSQALLENKLLALQEEKPDVIATANIGCQSHLESKSKVPVKHWIELIDDAI